MVLMRQLKLNTSKTEFIDVVRKNSFDADQKFSMYSKFSNHWELFGFKFSKLNQFTIFCLLLHATEDLFYKRHNTVDRVVLIELVRVMITSRLDYGNSLHYGLPAVLYGKLQRIMNCACRLLFRLSPGTPILRFSIYLCRYVCSKFCFLVIA